RTKVSEALANATRERTKVSKALASISGELANVTRERTKVVNKHVLFFEKKKIRSI
uniref:Uncharacterized protein n=1 Tax=Astyanax mexicanus TaxID=7994 RepID=A0A3B1IEF5_ASTMX